MRISMGTLAAGVAWMNGASASSDIKGVNVGGWLLLEEWMFSNGMFDKVAELADEQQGVVLPPALPNGFGEKWFSEGDLVNKLFNKFGAERTVDIMTQHRESYIQTDDFKAMAANGITRVRLPLGWWALIPESLGSAPVVVVDPAHADRRFVTVPRPFLERRLAEAQAAGLQVLLDVHAFPGGSADGSYNGVFPNAPMFFKDASLQQQGLDVVSALCDLYLGLPDALRPVVTGVTLMNEPAHLVPEDSDAMVAWLKSAVDIFRQRVVLPGGGAHPSLFVNLIGTSISDDGMLDFMLSTFSAEELSSWAILDVHVYYAWSGGNSGCMDLQDDCGYSCALDTDSASFSALVDSMYATAASSHSYWIKNGSVPLIACSEFSLATYHDSNNACRGADMLDMMYGAQAEGFDAQNMLDFSLFWTWKMPFGGSHEDAWSLQSYFERRAHH